MNSIKEPASGHSRANNCLDAQDFHDVNRIETDLQRFSFSINIPSIELHIAAMRHPKIQVCMEKPL